MNYQVVADESVDFRIVTQLRQNGVIVYSVAEQQPSINDESVLAIAVEKKALLLTEDKDFGELVFRLQLPHQGILLIRTEEDHKISSVTNAVLQYYEKLINKFSVIKNRKIRIKE